MANAHQEVRQVIFFSMRRTLIWTCMCSWFSVHFPRLRSSPSSRSIFHWPTRHLHPEIFFTKLSLEFPVFNLQFSSKHVPTLPDLGIGQARNAGVTPCSVKSISQTPLGSIYSLSPIWGSLRVKALIIPLLNHDNWLTAWILSSEWIQGISLNYRRIDNLKKVGRGQAKESFWCHDRDWVSTHALSTILARWVSLAKQKSTWHCPRLHRSKEDQVDGLGPWFQIVSNGYISSTKHRKLCYKEVWEMQFLIFRELHNRKASWRGRHVVGYWGSLSIVSALTRMASQTLPVNISGKWYKEKRNTRKMWRQNLKPLSTTLTFLWHLMFGLKN